MSFKQYLVAEVVKGLDETYSIEDWEKDHPGKAYYDLHISTIEKHERAAATFREYLGAGGRRILESGCGTGRWMAYFEKLGNRASYVAEHFEEGPETLFREIHRVLKPDGLFFVVVPFNNTFRRYVVNPILMTLWQIWKWRGRGLGFTEFRYSRPEMEGFLRRTSFEIVDVRADDFIPPWSKGLFCNLCDVGCFVRYEPKPPYEFGPLGRAVTGFIRSFGLWHSCGGI